MMKKLALAAVLAVGSTAASITTADVTCITAVGIYYLGGRKH